jgi:hypothetical protein
MSAWATSSLRLQCAPCIRAGLPSGRARRSRYAVRDADQFHVGEHDARALVAVIEHDIDAGGFSVRVELVGGSLDRFALVIAHRHDADREGGDGGWQDDAALVVALFDGGADDARDADTVAAHFHDLALAVSSR